jgi:ankyrin repeat protein
MGIDRDIDEFLKAIRDRNIQAAKRVMKRYGDTDLHFAVIECRPAKVRRILSRGADPNAKNDENSTALHDAAEYCPEAIPILLEHGADPHARSAGGLTPLHIATLRGSVEATKMLIPHTNINIRDNDGRTPFHLALEYSHCDAALLLLQHGADINTADNSGRTPLHLAAGAGCVEVVKRLLERGADPNVCDKNRNSVLHYAVKSLNKDIVKLILPVYRNVNMRNTYGETPLRVLIRECAKWEQWKQCYEIVKMLIEHGADPTIPDAKGYTPLDSAKLIGCPKLIELLSLR